MGPHLVRMLRLVAVRAQPGARGHGGAHVGEVLAVAHRQARAAEAPRPAAALAALRLACQPAIISSGDGQASALSRDACHLSSHDETADVHGSLGCWCCSAPAAGRHAHRCTASPDRAPRSAGSPARRTASSARRRAHHLRLKRHLTHRSSRQACTIPHSPACSTADRFD